MVEKVITQRRFLVPQSNLNTDSYYRWTIFPDGAASLKIGDCHRSVTLDFTVSDWNGTKAGINSKLKVLEEGLASFAKAWRKRNGVKK